LSSISKISAKCTLFDTAPSTKLIYLSFKCNYAVSNSKM
jgi:hypothetical protein